MNRQETINIMQHGSKRDKLDYLNDLDTAFDTYNRNVANSGEVIDSLIDFALISEDGEIIYELLRVICLAQMTQNLQGVDYSKIVSNLDNVPERFLADYIRVLNYTYDAQYLPVILRYENHKNKYVQEAVEDALIELRAIDK